MNHIETNKNHAFRLCALFLSSKNACDPYFKNIASYPPVSFVKIYKLKCVSV